jgi:hypothetical protein
MVAVGAQTRAFLRAWVGQRVCVVDGLRETWPKQSSVTRASETLDRI